MWAIIDTVIAIKSFYDGGEIVPDTFLVQILPKHIDISAPQL
jgi:hypothetical protein